MAARDSSLPEFDGRPTVRITNTLPDNNKVVGLSDKAFRVYIETICTCSRMENNGFLADAMMRKIAPVKVIAELISAGLLEKVDASTYRVHDYLKHQRSASEIKSFREAKSSAGALGAHKRWHVPNRRVHKDCEFCLQEARSA